MKTMMKWCAMMVTAAMLAATAWGQAQPGMGGGAQPGMGGGAMPKPMPQSLDEALFTVTIGDVQGFIEGLGAVTSQVSPMTNAEMFKAQVGQMVGDMALAGLPAGSGLALAFFPGNVMMGFVEVAPAQMSAYVQAMQTQGRPARTAGNVMAVAAFPEELDTAAKLAPAAAKMLSGAGTPTLKAVVAMDKVMAAYGPMIQMMMAMGMMQAQQAGGGDAAAIQKAQQMMQLQMLGFMNVAQQVKLLTIEIGVPAKGVQVEVTVAPAAGTDLATWLAAPVKPADDLLAMLPAKGAVRAAMGLNGAATRVFADKVLDAAFAQMQMPEPDKLAMRDSLKASMESSADSMAFDMVYPDGTLLSGVSVARTPGGTDPLTTIEKSMAEFKGAGMFNMRPQARVKTDMTFTRDVRKHGDVAIHQMRMTLTMEAGGDPGALDAMKSMFGPNGMTVDIALVNGLVVQALGGASIEEAIDAVKAGKHPGAMPLGAVDVLGKGMDGYLAVDAGRVLKAVTPMLLSQPQFAGQPGMAQTIEAAGMTLGAASPVSAGYSLKAEGMRGLLVIPTDLIKTVAQAVMAAQMAQMAGQPQPGMAPAAPAAPAAQPGR